MGKKLITIKHLDDMYKNGERELLLDKNSIISPGAKDYAKEKGIKVVYGSLQKTEVRNEKKVEDEIKSILLKDYKVSEEMICEITKNCLIKLK
ncbi:MAG: hypothetical protein COA82_06960 [Alkaliphilus sp.]|nr:hypothetical protein [bacterium AH-315-K05]PHS34821.1 MAG: hypothetical protein COA82_06960 [Alkaliphilus sp.]